MPTLMAELRKAALATSDPTEYSLAIVDTDEPRPEYPDGTEVRIRDPNQDRRARYIAGVTEPPSAFPLNKERTPAADGAPEQPYLESPAPESFQAVQEPPQPPGHTASSPAPRQPQKLAKGR